MVESPPLLGRAGRGPRGRPPIFTRRSARSPAWNEGRVRRELAAIMDGRAVFPSAGELTRSGRSALWRAIRQTGGPERWALEFGVSLASRRAGSRRMWTDERIERQLRRFLAGREEWPCVREFNDAGLASLFTAIYTYGGVERWAARMGVRRRPIRNAARPGRYWTADRIGAGLASFCAGRSTFPVASEFQAAGLMRLYWAASRHGGIRHWSDELGFSTATRRRLVAAA